MMKARVLGWSGLGALIFAGATPAFAQTTSTTGTTAVAPRPYQAAVISAVLPEEASKMGRDLREDPDPKRAGPGTEQAVMSVVDIEGKRVLVIVYMASANPRVQPAGAHMTIECSSYELRADGPPQEIVRRKVLQAEEGRRTAHHPAISPPDPRGNFLVTYGNDKNQDNPSAYATYINHRCEQLAPKVRYSIANNIGGSNDGASSRPILMPSKDGKTRFLASYTATNGDIGAIVNGEIDDDYMAAIPVEVRENGPGLYELVPNWPDIPDGQMATWDADGDPATPETIQLPAKTTPVAFATPTDIARQHARPIDDRRFLICSSWGNNRPSNDIVCTVAEYGTGKILWTDKVLKGDHDKMIYWNQVTIDNFGQNRFAIHAIKSNGRGKDTDVKGTNESLTTVFELAGDALVKVSEVANPGVHQSHSAICRTKRGVAGQEEDTIAVVSSPHTGTGRSGLTFVHFDPGAKTLSFNERTDRVATAWFADGQLLSNYYGENPMQQGRNYQTCLGDVENPGWDKEGGYMRDVKSFVVTAINGREPGSERNAMWISLVPAVTKTPVGLFTNPAPSTEVQSNPVVADAPIPAPKKDSSSGCACSTPGQDTSSSDFAGGLVLLGLAIGGIATRRRS